MPDTSLTALADDHGASVGVHVGADAVELFRAMIPLLSQGDPVPVGKLASATGRPQRDLHRILRRIGDVQFDDEGNVVGAGLTLRPTRHRFELDGQSLYTWSALGALVFPQILGQSARVTSISPSTGETIRLTVTSRGVDGSEPESAVLTVPAPAGDSSGFGSIRSAFCDRSNFYRDAAAARRHSGAPEENEILTLERGFELGAKLAAGRLTGLGTEVEDSEPLACRLPDEEQDRQWENVASKVFAAVEETRELEDGYAFRFPGEDGWIRTLADYVIYERPCCPFIQFELAVEPGGGPSWLKLRGGRDVKRFVQKTLHERTD